MNHVKNLTTHVQNLISNTYSLLNTQKNCTTQFSFRIRSLRRPKIIAFVVGAALQLRRRRWNTYQIIVLTLNYNMQKLVGMGGEGGMGGTDFSKLAGMGGDGAMGDFDDSDDEFMHSWF
ncbi:uncharacterized protein LOC133707629 [Rosa rugosa]|uniref:uncharacterized protein LOC133707629 n=1 Tax=Rosa rugosa TaxID=74645 RepID=UPI002B40E9E3|nr:uncharacterized protein LOC133707629 [Rosa rugosa]